jgi:hypothetical protein
MDVLHIVFSFLVYMSQSSIFVKNKHAPVMAIYFEHVIRFLYVKF